MTWSFSASSGRRTRTATGASHYAPLPAAPCRELPRSDGMGDVFEAPHRPRLPAHAAALLAGT